MRQQINRLLQQSAIAQDSTRKTILEESQQSSKTNTIPTQENLLPGLFLVGLGGFLLLYAVLRRRVVTPQKIHIAFEYAKKVRCKYCRFYSPNPYLQCAIHPSKVMKITAAQCPDYLPKFGNSHFNLFPKK